MMTKVKALQKGFYKAVIKEGEIFEVEPELFDSSWMEKIETEKPAVNKKPKADDEKKTL